MNIRAIIRELIRESLNEHQASLFNESTYAESIMSDVEEGVIDVNQKRLDKLSSEEDSARDSEDFSELKRIKEDQIESMDKMIGGFLKKVDLLKRINGENRDELISLQSSGSNVFTNSDIQEFSNENFEKGWGLRIETPNSSTDLIKVMDNNAYRVVTSNIEGVVVGDIFQLPNLKIGGNGQINIYRKKEERHENVKTINVENITKLVKNPK